MKISLVIPTFNSEVYIKETLDSLKLQSYKDFEVIVSDGASTDSTLSIVDSFKSDLDIKVRSSKDSGMYDALNKGFELAEGEIYCYLNSDDLYQPDTLSFIAQTFDKKPDVDFIFGNMFMLKTHKTRLIFYPPLIKPFFSSVNFSMFGQPSTFWRASCYKEVGGFDATLKMAGDYEFFCKCLQFRILKVDKFLSSFRLHDASLTSNHSQISIAEMKSIQQRVFSRKSRSQTLFLLGNLYYKAYNVKNLILSALRLRKWH